MLAIAQYVVSFEALNRQLAYETIADDTEDYHHCVARGRTVEIETRRAAGTPSLWLAQYAHDLAGPCRKTTAVGERLKRVVREWED